MVEDAKFVDPGKKTDDNDKVKDPNEGVPDQFKPMSKAEMAGVIQKQEEGLTSLTGRFNNLATQFNEVLSTKDKKGEDDKGTNKPDWEAAPEAAAHALFDAKMKPYADAFMTKAETDNLTSIEKLPYYDAFKTQIDEVMGKSSAQAKAVPGYARSAYNMIVGANLEKVKEIDAKRIENKAEHTETVSSGGAGGKPVSPEESLSDEQKHVADGQGIPYAKYAAWLKDPVKMREAALAGNQGK